jgi:hypothetical protein
MRRSAAGQRRPENMILPQKINQSELLHILPPKARINFPEAEIWIPTTPTRTRQQSCRETTRWRISH